MSWRNRDFFICCIVQLDDVIGQQDLESKGSQNTIATITWTAVKFLNTGRFFTTLLQLDLRKDAVSIEKVEGYIHVFFL